MSIVGFNFTKINAERKNAVVGQVSINNTISLKELTEAKLGFTGDRGALRVSFLFRSDYSPDLAVILMEGDVLLLIDAKQQASVLENWGKAKQLPREIAEPLMNHILDRCNIQALLMCKDLNLPPPVQLPKVHVTVPGEQPKAQPAVAAKLTKAEPIKTTKIKKK